MTDTLTLASLRARRAEAVSESAALMKKIEERPIKETEPYPGYNDDTGDELQFDRLVKEVEAIDKKLEDTKTVTTTKVLRGTPVGTGASFGGASYAAPKKDHALTAFKGPDGAENAYRSGMWLTASFAKDPTIRNQALNWCQANGLDHAVVKAQGEGINTSGGFLVPTEFNSAVVDLREEFGTFRRNARVVPMSSDSVTIPRRAGGLTAYYVGENAISTESQKNWDQITLTAKKLACLTRLSTELAEDAAMSVADDLAREMAYAFATAEDAAGWNGDGTSSYGGITGVRTKFVAGVDSFIGAVNLTAGHDTIAEVDAPDIARVMSVLPAYARRGAKFFMNQASWDGAFQRLIAAGGGNSTMTMDKTVPLRYLGYPVVIDQTLPGSGTIDQTPMFYFGDLAMAAKMGSRRDIRVVISGDRYLEYDQIGIMATERFDIVVHDIGDASIAGPIIAAMGNTS